MNSLVQIFIYVFAACSTGFLIAWVMQGKTLAKANKMLRSTQGYLESEKLKKEILQKENERLYQMKDVAEMEFTKKLNKANNIIRQMDSDIVLLQKSNEETEALLKAGEPVIYSLKLKLIEAQNTIARYKGQAASPVS